MWLVELADLGDPRLLASMVATVLGLGGAADARARLVEFLEDRHLLARARHL